MRYEIILTNYLHLNISQSQIFHSEAALLTARRFLLKKTKSYDLVFFCEDRTIEMFLRFRCLDLNTRHNHSASLRFCFQGFYSTISISVPPIKTTLIFSFDSTTTHSMICLTSLSSYSIGWFCSPSSMVKISSSRDLALSLF